MKLIKQTQLSLRRGRLDKVYEVDLCEVGDGAFVVNFRYGKRGRALQDGSMTSLPVDRAEAEKIFNKLVRSKTSKGYVDPSAPARPQPSAQAGRAGRTVRQRKPREESLELQKKAVLRRLRAGDSKYPEWPLNRAMWRAGELMVSDAEPDLLRYLTNSGSDRLRVYVAVWALGRCGSRAALKPLVDLYGASGTPRATRNIAGEALANLLSDKEREGLLGKAVESLPAPLAELARSGPAEAFTAALQELIQKNRRRGLEAAYTAYFVSSEHTRPAVLQLCAEAPIERGYFRLLRALYKTAEYRMDGQVFGLLAYRFERSPANPQADGYNQGGKQQPFSTRTRNYYRWRSWRTLRRLGQQAHSQFAQMAVGVLGPFSDADARSDGFFRYWAFCHLLYHRAAHVRPDKQQRGFVEVHSQPSSQGQGPPEAFPDLWDNEPAALMHLLDESACEPVHVFAVAALERNQAFLDQLDVDAIVMLLGRPYGVTAQLGFTLAEKKYDRATFHRELLLAVVNAAYSPAREAGHRWLDEQRRWALDDSELLCRLAFSVHADTREFTKRLLKSSALPSSVGQALVGRLLAHLLELAEGDDSVAVATDVADLLLRSLTTHLPAIGPDVLRDLVQHPLSVIQELAGDLLLLAHTAAAGPVPSDLLFALLSGRNEAVRAIGMRLLSELSDSDLSQRPELLFNLATSPHADLRSAIAPLVGRVARSYPECGRTVGELLLPRLRTKLDEVVHPSVASLLRQELDAFLRQLNKGEVLKLIHCKYVPGQQLGAFLLERQVPTHQLSVRELVRLAGHESQAIRKTAWSLCEASVARLKQEAEQTTGLVDCAWEDTRVFGMALLRERFDAAQLTPTLLVSLCDSNRAEVQQFGRELITRHIEERDGPQYLLQLSEHPSEALQLFATNYLDRFAAGNVGRITALVPYFTGILSRVNRGRIAKQRVLAFLQREALESEAAAEVIAPVLGRQSVTMAVENKASLIEAMLRLKQKYPNLLLPLQLSERSPQEPTHAV